MNKSHIIILLLTIVVGILIITSYHKQEDFTDFKINKTYVINLETDKDRLKDILNMGKRENIHIERFDAVNGRKLSSQDPYIKKFFSKQNKLKKSQKGCALSHIKIWEKIKENNDENVMILEDDAIIPTDFNNKLNAYIKELPDNWEMVLLGGNNIVGKQYSKLLLKANPLTKKHCNYGLFGYLIKKNTATKLLNVCMGLGKTIDVQLNKHFYKRNNVFFCSPQLITHNYDYYSNIFNKVRTNDAINNNRIEIIP
jgi:glycosyl transferase family 25